MYDFTLYRFLKKYDNLPSHCNYKRYNTKVKLYKDHTFVIKKNSFDILTGSPSSPHNGSMSEIEKLDKTLFYLKDTKKRIRDIACNNADKFEYFITLTFNVPDIKYSHEFVLSKLKNWLIVQRRNNPNMVYILVPEFHPTSTINRLHFHGLFGNVPSWELSQAFNPHNNKPLFTKWGSIIYNLDNYKLGFTTVSKIDSPDGVSNYISKYATKEILELVELKGKKKYWCSKNLDRPVEHKILFNGNVSDLSDRFDTNYLNTFRTDNRFIEVGSFCFH